MAVAFGITSLVYFLAYGNFIPPLILRTTPMLQHLCYFLLLCTLTIFVAHDWLRLGGALALKRGAVAAMASGFVVVPLGSFVNAWFGLLWFVGLLVLGFVAGSMVFMSIAECPGNVIASLAVFGCCLFLGSYGRGFLGQLEHVLGTVIVVVLVFWLVSALMTLLVNSSQGPISSWPWVTPVDKGSQEYEEKKDQFEAAAAAYPGMYPFWLQMQHLYRVESTNSNNVLNNRTGNSRQLYHGTPKQAAFGIITGGFRLPNKKGMFGRGIYFADCPLKSWGYTDGSMWVRNALILMCSVDLGRSKHEKAARNDLEQAPDRTFRQWLRGEERYTSVVGDDKTSGGALRLPEYVVYNTSRIQIEYICEAICVPAGTPETESQT